MKAKSIISILFGVVVVATIALFFILTTPETHDTLFYVNLSLSVVLETVLLFAIKNTKVWGTNYNTQSIVLSSKIFKYVATMFIIMVVYGLIGKEIPTLWYYIVLIATTIVHAIIISTIKIGGDIQVENEEKIKVLNDTKNEIKSDFNQLSISFKTAISSLTISDIAVVDTNRAITSLIQTVKTIPLSSFNGGNNLNDTLNSIYNEILNKITTLSIANDNTSNENIVAEIKTLCSNATSQIRLLK